MHLDEVHSGEGGVCEDRVLDGPASGGGRAPRVEVSSTVFGGCTSMSARRGRRMGGSTRASGAIWILGSSDVTIPRVMRCVNREKFTSELTSTCRFKRNYLAEMWSGSEEGSYLRLLDCGATQLQI